MRGFLLMSCCVEQGCLHVSIPFDCMELLIYIPGLPHAEHWGNNARL